MPAAVVELDGNPVAGMNLYSVDGAVRPAGIGIAHQDRTTRPYIGTAIAAVPDGAGKPIEIDVLFDHGVLEKRNLGRRFRRDRLEPGALFHPCLQSVKRGQLMIDAQGKSRPASVDR